jgi:hypothetical protein
MASAAIIPVANPVDLSSSTRVEEGEDVIRATDLLLSDPNQNNNNTSNKTHVEEDTETNFVYKNNFINNSPTIGGSFLGPAEKVNVESDKMKFFSGLKTNLQADMETFTELFLAILYAIYGIFVGLVVAMIPRRFRYKDISGQIVLVTGAGSGIGKLMAKKLALNHGAVVVAWDINKTGEHS